MRIFCLSGVVALTLVSIPTAYALEGVSLGTGVELEQAVHRETHNGHRFGNGLTIDIEASQRVARWIRIHANGRAREDTALKGRNRQRMREAYVDLRLGDFDLRLGRQIHAWGRTDILNPTNRFGPSDFAYFPDQENEEMGLTSGRAQFHGEGWDVELVIAPAYQSSDLPQPGSRWYPNLPSGVGPSGAQIPLHYDIEALQTPKDPWREPQVGLRLSGRLPGVDISMSYFDGWSVLPHFSESVAGGANGGIDVTVHQNVNRLRVVGGDMASVIGDFGVRLEGAYVLTDDRGGKRDDVDDPYVHYVLGVDTTFEHLVGDADLFVLLEWSHQMSTTDAEYENWDLAHVFSRTLFGRLRLSGSSPWSMEGDAAYDFVTDSVLLRPRLAYEIADNLSVEMVVDLPLGSDESLFGGYRRSQAVRVVISYQQLWEES